MPEPLTVFLWLWQGWRPVYDASHVNAMCRMLRERLSLPHRVICVTDMPARITECETYPLWDIEFKMLGFTDKPRAQQPNCYRRLRMFSQWAAEQWPGRILSIDLDVVLLKDIAPLITSEDFRINRGRVCKYNGGMWMLRTGSRLKAWDELTPTAFKVTQRKGMIGSDQAWLSHVLPGEAIWDATDGVMQYSPRAVNLSKVRAIFCAGGIKPWNKQFALALPTIASEYRRFQYGPA